MSDYETQRLPMMGLFCLAICVCFVIVLGNGACAGTRDVLDWRLCPFP